MAATIIQLSGGKWRYWGQPDVVYDTPRTPAPVSVRESTLEPRCTKNPRGLPNEEPVGNGDCLKESAPMRPIMLTPKTIGFIRAESRWLASQPVEHFVAFAVNQGGDVIGRLERTDRQPRECTVDLGNLVREARGQGAAGLIAMHNHPRAAYFSEALGRHTAGCIEPSAADVSFTRLLRGALQKVNIQLCDHLICGPNSFGYSFMESTARDDGQAWPCEVDEREAEERRLWGPYGGVRPSWAR